MMNKNSERDATRKILNQNMTGGCSCKVERTSGYYIFSGLSFTLNWSYYFLVYFTMQSIDGHSLKVMESGLTYLKQPREKAFDSSPYQQ